MPRGYSTPVKWTSKQRDIYDLFVEGKSAEEIHEAGYGTENIGRVSRAMGRGERPGPLNHSPADLFAQKDSIKKIAQAITQVFKEYIRLKAVLEEKDEEICSLLGKIERLNDRIAEASRENQRVKKQLAETAKVVFGEKR